MSRTVPQNSVVVGNNSNDNGNIVNSYNNNFDRCNISISGEKRQILDWLSALTSRGRHQAVRDARVDGVGEWLLRTEQFSTWCTLEDGAAKPVLLCYGAPGVGKTYISSLVIDTLSNGTGKGNAAIAYVYCDFSAQNVQSAKTVLASVLRQVVGALAQTPDEVQEAFEHADIQVDGCGLRLQDILKMLIVSLSHSQMAFICIDALDEFPTKHRAELWDSLRRVIWQCPNSRLFLTGRPQIATEVGNYFPEHSDTVIIEPALDDIGRYIEKRLKEDLVHDAMDKELRADIPRIILERISGIFLLVCINMDAILAEATIHQRRQALDRMTKGPGLQDGYNTTLDRIRQQGGSKEKFGMEALMWISHSERPLRSEEFCHALGVELGAEDFNTKNVPSIQTVLACTLGLVTFDKKESTVRLLHHTLQEYLRGRPTLFVTPHSMIAEICLTYLNSRMVRALPPNPGRSWPTPPFLGYATCFWGTHAAIEVTETVKSLALRLLDGYENHVSATIFERTKPTCEWYKRVGGRGMSGLHCIAIWGIAEIASAMLEKQRWNINFKGWSGETPLNWALLCANDRVAELFLEQRDVEPDNVNRMASSALSSAIRSGNERMAKVLLERRDVNHNLVDRDGRTPLSLAAKHGSEGIVKLILERGDVNPNSLDNDGRTPLSFAVEYGHEAVVKLLLERGDVDPNLVDKNGLTPLIYAIKWEWGGEDIVKLLLERKDINPNSPDNDGRTPLSFAVECGDELMKLLLERGDVDPNLVDKNGLTPLSYAVRGEWEGEGALKLLLGYEGVSPNLSDNDGRTPLSFASEYRDEAVVKLLLERGDIDPNSVDKKGLTPLLHAVQGESEGEGVVKLLLERGDVDPNSENSDGRTPLSLAAEYGYELVVKVLLEHGGVNPNSLDSNGRTPLFFAAWSGEEGVVKLLLEHGDVNFDLPDNYGLTALSIATIWRQGGIVRLLS